MPTQHRSRRALAIQRQRIDCARAVEDLRLDDDEALIGQMVDEEPLAGQAVWTVLRREGWSVLEAADAIAALAVADARRLDLLAPDFDMPSVSGVSLAEQLRAFDEAIPVPVVSSRSDAARSARRLHGRTEFARSMTE